MRTIRLRIAATETHCGSNCAWFGEHCQLFQQRIRLYDHVRGCEVHKRLPECIAAEKEAGK